MLPVRRGGIFSGFGAVSAPLQGDLSLLPGANIPFAKAVQEVVKADTAPGLSTDGQWGPCSQGALYSSLSSRTGETDPAKVMTPANLAAFLSLDKFGASASQVKVPTSDVFQCTDAKQQPAYTENKPDPMVNFAKAMGLPVPALSCATDEYEAEGKCVKKPVDVKPDPLKVTSDGKQVITFNTGLLKGVKVNTAPLAWTQGVTVKAAAPFWTKLTKVGAGAGVAPNYTPIILAGVAVLGIGSLVIWLATRSSSATPNCGYYPNCGE